MNARKSKDKPVGVVARWLLPSIGSFCLLIVLYLLVFSAWRFLLDSDTGWHIRAGELILQTRAPLRQDPFSHTMSGQAWFAWEWLADALMGLAHRRLGLAGVVGGAILILLAAYAALHQLMMRRGSDPIIAFAITIFATLCSIVHWLARPHLFSIALMILWYALVENYRRKRSNSIFFVPVLIALWANLHGAFVSTFVILAIYAVGEWLESGARGSWRGVEIRRALRTYAIVGGLSAIAAMATPYGYRLYGHIARYLSDRQLLSSIQEFQSPNFHSTDGKLIEVLLLSGAIAAVNALRQKRFIETGLLLLWGHLTLQSERHVTLAAAILTPIIAEQLTLLTAEIVDHFASAGDRLAKAARAARSWYRDTMKINRQLTGAFVYLAILSFVIILPQSRWADKLLSPRFSSKQFPVAAADFIERTKPPGNLYAHDQFGGYLIYRLYPEYKVFVDGRSDFYRQGRVLDEVDGLTLVKPQWSETLDKYGVQFMVLRRDEPLASVALSSGQWASAFEDSVAQVLIKKSSPHNQAVTGLLRITE